MVVFIVDDEQIGIFIIRQMLLDEKVAEENNIHAFSSAKEAIEALAQKSYEELPDIVLLDLSMPEMDGWQFLESLKLGQEEGKIKYKIFILTSSLVSTDELRAKNNPIVAGFFQKPLSIEDVRSLKSEKNPEFKANLKKV